MALELMERTYKEIRDPPYQKLKTPRKPRVYGVTTTEPTGHELAEIDRELRAAKKKLEIQQGKSVRKCLIILLSVLQVSTIGKLIQS